MNERVLVSVSVSVSVSVPLLETGMTRMNSEEVKGPEASPAAGIEEELDDMLFFWWDN
jgi:hypothetical protein